MASNIYNIRLRTGMELITEILTVDELNEIDTDITKLFNDDDREDTVLLSHPIVVVTIPVTSNGEVFLENFYHPYLQHSKHACVAIDTDLIVSVDEIHPNAAQDYVEAVIAVYGHMYEDSEDTPDEQSTPTVH